MLGEPLKGYRIMIIIFMLIGVSLITRPSWIGFSQGYYSQVWLTVWKKYSPKIKVVHPYYICPIEIILFWAKITYLKSLSIALVFSLQIDMK